MCADTARPVVRKHDSLAVRLLLVAAGSLCLLLALAGVFTPVLPTTPFVLLAAACFARASTRLHRWLLANRRFGPLIDEWERHRSIPRRVKAFAIGMMATSLTVSIVFFTESWWLKAALALLGVLLALWMNSIPSRDAPRDPQ